MSGHPINVLMSQHPESCGCRIIRDEKNAGAEQINRREIAAAATAGGRDAATSEEVNIAAAATAGQRGAATPLEQRSEDPEHTSVHPSRSVEPRSKTPRRL